MQARINACCWSQETEIMKGWYGVLMGQNVNMLTASVCFNHIGDIYSGMTFFLSTPPRPTPHSIRDKLWTVFCCDVCSLLSDVLYHSIMVWSNVFPYWKQLLYLLVLFLSFPCRQNVRPRWTCNWNHCYCTIQYQILIAPQGGNSQWRWTYR